MNNLFEFKTLQKKYDYLAPDGSEIRLLPTLEKGGLCHCTLPVGMTSSAVKHKTVDEVWYCLSGSGSIWQENNEETKVKDFTCGDCFSIPVGCSFQFKNIGSEPLCIIISTMPKWPGADEAIKVDGIW
ncbi:cupin domain-containing protein [Runella limosa]|uniref:cupin domain-containing protein n=1 Tax=Runella limosa TaxID=370978 RepID=UPI00048AA207|nr:cupin domain-containing protein [Runella limosa]